VKATGSGTLTVCTKAKKSGVSWRATIVQVLTSGAASSVGTGSTTACTGPVSRPVVGGVKYEVFVTYDNPLPPPSGTFPTGVEVQLTGPVTVSPRSDPVLPTAQYVGMYGASLTNPSGWDAFSLETSADGTRVTRIALDRFFCGSFAHEHFFSIGVNIPIINRRFATQVSVSLPDHIHSLKIDGAFFDADGFGSTAEQALGGLIFNATPFRTFLSQRISTRRNRFIHLGVRSTTHRRALLPRLLCDGMGLFAPRADGGGTPTLGQQVAPLVAVIAFVQAHPLGLLRSRLRPLEGNTLDGRFGDRES
jgi:hypothetical protein